MESEKTAYEEILSGAINVIGSDLELNQKMLMLSELLKNQVPYYNWVGFYLLDQQTNELVLGPYVGAPTDHTRIAVGKGVCGQVAQNKETMIVQDVSRMDNYLSCSINVKSEIVVPILKEGRFVAEIDIDSHALAPFGEDDSRLLEKIAAKIAFFFD